MSPEPLADGPLLLAAPVPGSTWEPPGDVDLAAIAASLKTDHVWGPADQVAGLEKIVSDARAQGHDINIVVLTEKMPRFTVYRDIATELQHEVGGTVLVLGPNAAGSSSTEFSRVQLEEATDNLTLSNPTQAARDMVDYITDPGVNYTLLTIVLIVVVAIGAVLGRLRTLRRRRGAADAASGSEVGSGPVRVGAAATDADRSEGSAEPR
ncbi:Rv1476 family membrane protein [Gordonia sp. NPDC003376]